jgi:hypothetical protein
MDHLHQGGRRRDDPEVLGSGQREPSRDGPVTQHGLGKPLTVQDQRAVGNGGGAGHPALAPPWYERLPQHSEAHLNWALITMMTRRLTRQSPRTDSWSKKSQAAQE